MNKVSIQDLNKYYDSEVELQAFVDNIRNLQYVQFVILRDCTGKVQMTIEKNEENVSLVELIDNFSEVFQSDNIRIIQNEEIINSGAKLKV